MISKEQVFKIAHLSRLAIDDSKADLYSKNLSAILGYMEQLNKVDVNEVEPMTHVHGSKNIFREDIVEESMPVKEALKNAPDVNGQFFRVPLIKDGNVDN
ncbi:MAG: Asp-tRNA(Asn)/Glu-tRNA(Gln) amidotransferase subunit GatC [bacterium]|nr:Asp-tRNA(Asn)/Glu-tRNA(Gln) amidotransferase subunit GatC [bacterium]